MRTYFVCPECKNPNSEFQLIESTIVYTGGKFIADTDGRPMWESDMENETCIEYDACEFMYYECVDCSAEFQIPLKVEDNHE